VVVAPPVRVNPLPMPPIRYEAPEVVDVRPPVSYRRPDPKPDNYPAACDTH